MSQGVFLRRKTKLVSGASLSEPPFVPPYEPQLFPPQRVNARLNVVPPLLGGTTARVSEHHEDVHFCFFMTHRITVALNEHTDMVTF